MLFRNIRSDTFILKFLYCNQNAQYAFMSMQWTIQRCSSCINGCAVTRSFVCLFAFFLTAKRVQVALLQSTMT